MSNSTKPDVWLNSVIGNTQSKALTQRESSSYYFDVCRYTPTPISHLYHFADTVADLT